MSSVYNIKIECNRISFSFTLLTWALKLRYLLSNQCLPLRNRMRISNIYKLINVSGMYIKTITITQKSQPIAPVHVQPTINVKMNVIKITQQNNNANTQILIQIYWPDLNRIRFFIEYTSITTMLKLLRFVERIRVMCRKYYVQVNSNIKFKSILSLF